MNYLELKQQFSQDKLKQLCQRYHIRKLALFGSILRDDFTPNSDIDLLVEFETGHTPGLAFFALETEFSNLLGRKADLNTFPCLSPYFRHEVERESTVIYEQV